MDKEFIETLKNLLTDVAQLMDGWHTDSAWSEWDEQVRKRVSESLKQAYEISQTSNDLKFLKQIFLTCPETHERQNIVSVLGKEAGIDHYVIRTKGASTGWKHTVRTEEL